MEGLSPATIAKIGGVHKLIALHDYGIAAVARDSIYSLPESKGANKFGATFETPCGRLLVSLYLTRRLWFSEAPTLLKKGVSVLITERVNVGVVFLCRCFIGLDLVQNYLYELV